MSQDSIVDPSVSARVPCFVSVNRDTGRLYVILPSVNDSELPAELREAVLTVAKRKPGGNRDVLDFPEVDAWTDDWHWTENRKSAIPK